MTGPIASSAAGPLTFGIVGCGAISAQHLEAIDALDGARLGCVASASADRARAAGERWGVPWTTDVDDLLARPDLDAISILTPSGLHADQALAALRHGKHVLVEKPIALSVGEADAVIDEARVRDRTLATVSQRRFEGPIRALHDAVDDGAFGTVSLILTEGLYWRPQSYYDSGAWRGTVALDGGVLMNQAIHTVDLVRWLGGPVASVTGHVATLTHRMEAEDVATVSLRFASGALGSIVVTTSAANEEPTVLRVIGDRGAARIAGGEVLDWDVPGFPRPAGDDTADHAPGTAATSGATWGTTAAGYLRQYTDFIDAVRTGRAPFVTGRDGREAVAVVTAAYESSRTGRAVVLEEVAV
jgi:predicted dehydrogenase